jgi:hypothetical protein
MPLILVMTVFTLVNNFSDSIKLSGFCSVIKSIIKWAIGICFTVFLGIIAIQGLLGSTFDGISIKTAKYTIDKLVPIVGGMVSDSAVVLISCTLLIKNAVGVAGIIIIAGIVITPVFGILANYFVFKVAGAVLEPIAGKNISKFAAGSADVLLMLAEAEVEAGSLTNALALVNQVRARAAVKAQGPGTSTANIAVPINDPSITWAIYKVEPYPAFPTQAYAREAVRTERKIELALEGHRFFDFKRWGILETALNSYVNGVGGGAEKNRRSYLTTAAPVTAKYQNFPIPTVQVQLSTVGSEVRVPQNTGW